MFKKFEALIAGGKAVKNLFTGGAKNPNPGEAIKKTSPSGSLTQKRDAQDKVIKGRDETFKKYGTSEKDKVRLRSEFNQAAINRKFARIYDKKSKGGRVGYKKGTPSPFLRKSNKKKIEEAFKATTPFMVKKDKPKKRLMAKKGSPDPKKKKKFPDLTGDGKVTFADILKGRGVINGKKKTKKKII